MIGQEISYFKSICQSTWLGHFPLVARILDNVIDFLAAPLTGVNTRSYWPELVAAIAIAVAVFAIRDRKPGEGPLHFLRYILPRDSYLHPSTIVDCKLIIVNSIVVPFIRVTWHLNVALFAGLLLKLLILMFGPSPHILPWNGATLVAFTFIAALADDFGYYVYHYLMHHVPWMWAFHKVHHSAERLTVFANVRVHPMEILFDAPFRAVAVCLILGPALYLSSGQPHPVTVFGISIAAAFIGAIGAQLHHTHIWLSWGPALDRVITSPAMHQIHHSKARRHWNKNLGGNFTLWDWMFGTLYLPRERETLDFGLNHEEPQPHPTLLAAYLVPFQEIWSALTRPGGRVQQARARLTAIRLRDIA